MKAMHHTAAPAVPLPSMGFASTEGPERLSGSDFRNAMARVGASVHIVTTDGAAGRAGFTASAVCSVTDDPPTLLVCLNRNASAYPAVKENRVVCVNALRAGHEAISSLFGGKTPMQTRFNGAHWSTGATGAPILVGAAVSFDCKVAGATRVGTHDVLFCEVVAVHTSGAANSLVYFDRRYHTVCTHG